MWHFIVRIGQYYINNLISLFDLIFQHICSSTVLLRYHIQNCVFDLIFSLASLDITAPSHLHTDVLFDRLSARAIVLIWSNLTALITALIENPWSPSSFFFFFYSPRAVIRQVNSSSVHKASPGGVNEYEWPAKSLWHTWTHSVITHT